MRRLAVIAALLLSACGREAVTPVFHAELNPPTLADWGVLASDGKTLSLGDGVTPYSLQQPLFTDYAHKLRTVWVPEGEATPVEGAAYDFPVGTVISKTFYYPVDSGNVLKRDDTQSVNAARPLDLSGHRLIETRILARREDGWHPVSYIWNAEQTEARLARTGAVVPLTIDARPSPFETSAAQAPQDEGLFKKSPHPEEARSAVSKGEGDITDFAYIVPNENQCAACHADNATTGTIRPLGPRPEQLAGSYDYGNGPVAQLAQWQATGLIASDPATDAWPAFADTAAALPKRARAYLASNCAHCHNPVGPADTSGLDLTMDADSPVALGTCKLPIAAGSGTGGHRYGIEPGHPGRSILAYRMASTDPGAMMPELGRALVHAEGLALVRDWITGLDGTCEG